MESVPSSIDVRSGGGPPMSSQGILHSQDNAAKSPGYGAKHLDSPLMYCSYFTYCIEPTSERILYCEQIKVKDMVQSIRVAESK